MKSSPSGDVDHPPVLKIAGHIAWSSKYELTPTGQRANTKGYLIQVSFFNSPSSHILLHCLSNSDKFCAENILFLCRNIFVEATMIGNQRGLPHLTFLSIRKKGVSKEGEIWDGGERINALNKSRNIPPGESPVKLCLPPLADGLSIAQVTNRGQVRASLRERDSTL